MGSTNVYDNVMLRMYYVFIADVLFLFICSPASICFSELLKIILLEKIHICKKATLEINEILTAHNNVESNFNIFYNFKISHSLKCIICIVTRW